MIIVKVVEDSQKDILKLLVDKKYGKVIDISSDDLFLCEKQGEKIEEVETIKSVDDFDIVGFCEAMDTKLSDWNYWFDWFGVNFQWHSPAGQDFYFFVEYGTCQQEFLDNIFDYYETFDCSEAAYLWLDNSGHGKNGAPYEMCDVYKDMEACENAIKELNEILERKLNKGE